MFERAYEILTRAQIRQLHPAQTPLQLSTYA